MLDFNLALELLAVLATLVYISLLISENFSRDERASEEFEYTKRSLLDQQIVPRY